MFYTQSVVLILYLVRVLYSVRSPRFIPSPYFIPSPQSVVRSPQSVFYTDRLPFATGVDVKKRDGGGGEAKKLTFSRNSSATKANP